VKYGTCAPTGRVEFRHFAFNDRIIAHAQACSERQIGAPESAFFHGRRTIRPFERTGLPVRLTNTAGSTQRKGRNGSDALPGLDRGSGRELFGLCAGSPDCVASGKSLALVEREIRSAIRAHIEELEQNGSPIPAPHSIAKYVDA